MRIAYIAHPISGDIQANLADIRRIVRMINMQYPSVLPFVPYYVDVVSMNDEVPEERARGIKNDLEIIQRKIPDEIWLCGPRISAGMQGEIEEAKKFGIPVVNYIGKL
jgi:hypothetical protein